MALSHDTQKKAVSISFQGEGKREVRVGYVIENPIWKTSYRLVLDKKDKPYLQGWAIVENPTDEDWKDVKMALVSGRPISFQMDLYTPLYVPRPTVELELFASLRPPTYNGDLAAKMPEAKAAADAREDMDRLAGRDKAAEGRARRGLPAPGAGLANGAFSREFQKKLDERLELRQSVNAAASAAKLGDFFQYALNKAVSLPRQKMRHAAHRRQGHRGQPSLHLQ